MKYQHPAEAPVAYMREGATSVLHNFRFDKPCSGPWLALYAHPDPEVAALRADAARYRWLRDSYDPSVHDDDGGSFLDRAGSDLDDAIDDELRAALEGSA